MLRRLPLARSLSIIASLCVALSCGKPPPETDKPHVTPPVETDTDTEPEHTGTIPAERALSDDELLSRISLDLRGVRPTVAELERFDGDPDLLDEMIEEFLHDPRFSERTRDFYGELLPIRLAPFFVGLTGYADRYTDLEIMGHVGEEPLRMFSHVAENDLPYSDLLQGNWSMANEVVADLFPVDYPATATGWQEVSYTDGRPESGLLTTNGMWWWKGSMANNRNRARANVVSSLFLCDDYLEREVPFATSDELSSEAAVADAIANNPGCVSCHQTLDPFAAHFWGFYQGPVERTVPSFIEVYHADRENWWEPGPPPGFFGLESEGLGTLGTLIAEDPRFARCFVKESWQVFTGTDADVVEVDLEPVETAFQDSGMKVREAFKAIARHPAYQGYDSRFTRKLMSPQMISTMVANLTGFVWTEGGWDQLETGNGNGMAYVAGSGDGEDSGYAVITVSAALVMKRLSEGASRHAAQHDSETPTGRILFSDGLTFTETTQNGGEEVIRAELQSLQLRMLGKQLATDSPEVEGLFALWGTVYDLTSDPVICWSAVVSAILRDPDMVMY